MKILITLIAFTHLTFAQTELKGTIKNSGQPCSLHIQQIYYIDNIETPENIRADVIASLEDDNHNISHEKEFFFTLKPASRQNLFSGVADNQKDQLNVLTRSGTLGFDLVDSYAVKWWHVNHFHSAQCVNLQIVQD